MLCVASLVTTLLAARLFSYDSGTAAGLMAGAFTESTVIGTASDTIDRLDIPEAEKTRLKNNIPVAYAVTYLVGTGLVIWFLSSGAPRLLRINLKEESPEIQAEALAAGGAADEAIRLAYKEWSIRAFRIAGAAAGRTVADLERQRQPRSGLRGTHPAGTELIDGAPDTVLQPGDVVADRGHGDGCCWWEAAARGGTRGPRASRFPMATLDAVVTKRESGGAAAQGAGRATRAGRRPCAN